MSAAGAPPAGALAPPGSAGAVVWLTGVPSSGKSTIARELWAELRRRGLAACLLDGDEVRARLHPPPGYDDASRERFYATLADLAALLASQALVVVVAATAHRREYRDRARRAAGRFLEVHVRCDPALAAARDDKGLYRRASRGEVSQVPGADLPYEEPESPEVVVDGALPAPESARLLVDVVMSLGAEGEP